MTASIRSLIVVWLLNLSFTGWAAEPWPALPPTDQRVELPAQEWPLRPGPRTIQVLIHYPTGKLSGVTPQTGLMLTLHNWGGTDCVGTASPQVLANRFNVIALCVNYLQSGPKDSIEGPEPYDFGYLQGLDALRSLQWVFSKLQAQQTEFDSRRIFATGGSGGGNVTLMANKLAPRTFACVVDLCGMKKLSDDIAFNVPGGSDLDARYRRDLKHPYALSLDDQELRWPGHPQHLSVMKELGTQARIVTVHGVDDRTCPFEDAQEFVANAQAAKLDIVPRFIQKSDLDGKVFSSTGHSLGNRTEIVLQVAGQWLDPKSPDALRRTGLTDFERRDVVRYPTRHGAFEISYKDSFPVGRFVPAITPKYADHSQLMIVKDTAETSRPIQSQADWALRRQHIVSSLEAVMGSLPAAFARLPLTVRVEQEERVGSLIRRKLVFRSDAHPGVPAYLFIPPHDAGAKLPAVLCLQQTTSAGKSEPAGLAGDSNLHYALHLAERGYVTLAPDYPSFGDYKYDFSAEQGYASGSMKAVWDNVRAVDLLQSLPEVDGERIGCIGHSLGGHNSMFTAVFEPRIKVIVSNCGFCTFRKDDVPSWNGPRYMPRIASVYGNDAAKLPFDFPEIVAAFAPRPFLACAAEQDSDFDPNGVEDCINAARPVYQLLNAAPNLELFRYPGPHAFPEVARRRAYEFLDRHLKHTPKKN